MKITTVVYLLEVFELLIAGETFFLGHSSMDGDGREVLFRQELSQSNATLNRLDEDYNLKTKITQISL